MLEICKDCNEQVKKGDVGVIVMSFTIPNEANEVEVLDENGYTNNASKSGKFHIDFSAKNSK